jgi:hypothetical protein
MAGLKDSGKLLGNFQVIPYRGSDILMPFFFVSFEELFQIVFGAFGFEVSQQTDNGRKCSRSRQWEQEMPPLAVTTFVHPWVVRLLNRLSGKAHTNSNREGTMTVRNRYHFQKRRSPVPDLPLHAIGP